MNSANNVVQSIYQYILQRVNFLQNHIFAFADVIFFAVIARKKNRVAEFATK